MPKPRNYSAEYQRRLDRERERAAREGRPFSRSRARGHGDTAADNTRRRVRRLYNKLARQYGKQYPSWDTVKASAQNYSWSDVEKVLRSQEANTKAYKAGDPLPGRGDYVHGKNTVYPIEFFWYHGN
jgi:hypothetical protein